MKMTSSWLCILINQFIQDTALLFLRILISILQKNGIEVGQTEPHVHFHYIPRGEGNTSTLEFRVRMT